MKKLMFLFAVLLVSCAHKNAFNDAATVKELSKDLQACEGPEKFVDKAGGLKIVEQNMFQNGLGAYVLLYDGKSRGVVVQYASPSYDWTREEAFEEHIFKGACKTQTGMYFLVYVREIAVVAPTPRG